MTLRGCLNLSSHPLPEPTDFLAACSDLRFDSQAADVDWAAAELDGAAGQSPGGGLPA